MDALLTRFDGRAGFHSVRSTRRLLSMLDEIQPDVVHLHVLLGYYINIELLFEWLSEHDCKVIWTLHDCWAFTGHCHHFTYAKCDQWCTGCASSAPCPQVHEYPETIFGGSRSVRWSYEQKKRLFTMIPADRMRLIAPSRWLADLVGRSYLGKYEIVIEHNTVDVDVYHPVHSDFKREHSIEDKFLILGVASKWTERKGLNDFIRLALELDPNLFSVAVVGLSKEQVRRIGKIEPRIIALERTESLSELVEIYSAADVFFNPTREDNYPTVNLEAEACGTPVVTYDTGGCAETVKHENSYVAKDFEEALDAIVRVCN